MNLQRWWAMARKEFIQIFRDPRSLGMAIAMPMMLLFLFGYALTLDVDKVPLVIWDQSNTKSSRDFISRFDGSRYFSIKGYVNNYPHAIRAIDSREALIVLVIPVNFDMQLNSTESTKVQAVVDGSDSNTATISLGYAEAIVTSYSQEVVLQRIKRTTGRTIAFPMEVRPRVWFNEELESTNYVVPGLIAVIMMVIAALLTSLTVAREWERGTMEQLISTPVKKSELIFGKLFPYFVIGMLDVLLAVLMGEFVFHVPLRGSIPLLFTMAAIFLLGTLSLGMFISIVTKSQLLSSQLAMILTFLPAFLLSGFMFAVDNMPRPIQLITHIVPAKYFITLLKGIYLKGIGLSVLWLDAILLGFFTLVILVIAHIKFKKKLE